MSDNDEQPHSQGLCLTMRGAPFCRLLMAALLLFPAVGQTSEEPTGNEKPVLRFNVSTGGYPPYLIVTNDHQYSGIAYDVVSRIAGRMGYEVIRTYQKIKISFLLWNLW